MMDKRCALRAVGIIALCCSLSPCFSQSNYADNINDWKKLFPREDVVAAVYKEVVDFSLNAAPKEGESRVKASVLNEMKLVPVKDYLKYDDGLFYNDEMTIENVKVLNTEGKDIKFEKSCGSYKEESIFHSDAKLCVVAFPLGERGKSYKYSYTNSYKHIKFLTSFYF